MSNVRNAGKRESASHKNVVCFGGRKEKKFEVNNEKLKPNFTIVIQRKKAAISGNPAIGYFAFLPLIYLNISKANLRATSNSIMLYMPLFPFYSPNSLG